MPKLYAYQMVGEGLVLLTPISGEHPGHELPGMGEHPDHELPGFPGRPSHPIGRPGRPVDPGYGRPGGGGGGIPDNELPATPPPTLLPGYTLVMLRGPDG